MGVEQEILCIFFFLITGQFVSFTETADLWDFIIDTIDIVLLWSNSFLVLEFLFGARGGAENIQHL